MSAARTNNRAPSLSRRSGPLHVHRHDLAAALNAILASASAS